MKRFKYKAKDRKTGREVKGEVEAQTASDAAALIRRKELIAVAISPVRLSSLNFIARLRERITHKDITTFTRQLATMINAGLPITEAFLILRSQTKGEMQRVVAQILADVEGGKSLSTSFSKFPKVFPPTYTALVHSGEVGGVLDRVLMKLADNLEKQQEFRGKIKGALIYPAIIVAGLFIVAAIMLIFVIPRLTALYTQFETELPLVTRILIGISTFASRLWFVFFIAVGSAIWAVKLYRATEKGRRTTDELLFKIPIFGDLHRQLLLAELTRTLSLMIGAGVSILESLTVSAKVIQNKVLSEALEDAAKMVEKGFPVAFSFAKHPEAFPFVLSQMAAVGEETGKLDEVLEKVSHVFEVESDQKAKALTSAVEPIVLIVLGFGVAFLVLAIILPIYNLAQLF